MPLARMLLGDPARLDGPALARGVRRGDEAYAAICVRWLGDRIEPEANAFLRTLLGDTRTSIRTAAAWGLAWQGRAEALAVLGEAWEREGTEEGKLAIAAAQIRCGEDARAVEQRLSAFEHRELLTPLGRRTPALITGAGSLTERLALVIDGERPALLAARRAALSRRTDDRTVILSLAALRHPADVAAVVAAIRTSGRREEHTLALALGWAGAVEAATTLREALRATDVDPGRGFAQRRLAATSLGRLGLRVSVPWLLRALEDEALDYEGRPGAGLGIQYPVRTNLLWALGEIGDPATIPLLTSYLGNLHGSAFGGFYLPAMDALAKFGKDALPALRDVATTAPDEVASNALGVLHANGQSLHPWRNDPRPLVRQIANLALERT